MMEGSCAVVDASNKPTETECANDISDKVITMRIGCGGGGFGDAISTRPCARLLEAYGQSHSVSTRWATRFPSVYDGLVQTVDYDKPEGDLLELHWCIYPDGATTWYECYFYQATRLLDYDIRETFYETRPVWPVARKPRPIIAINTFAGLPHRRWPLKRWQRIAHMLMETGWNVVQLNPHQRLHLGLNDVNVYQTDNPNDMARYLATCALYLGNHSALWQIAMAVNCPSVTVHGASCPHWFNVNPLLHRTIEAKGPCRYCYDRGPWNVGKETEWNLEKYNEWYNAMRSKMELCRQPCIDHSVDEIWWAIQDQLAITWRGGGT